MHNPFAQDFVDAAFVVIKESKSVELIFSIEYEDVMIQINGDDYGIGNYIPRVDVEDIGGVDDTGEFRKRFGKDIGDTASSCFGIAVGLFGAICNDRSLGEWDFGLDKERTNGSEIYFTLNRIYQH